MFTALDNVTVPEFQDGLTRAEQRIDQILNLIAGRLGLDHDRVLGSRYAIPLMIRYLDQSGGFADANERDNLLFWYVHTMLWGRYSASTETTLRQDLLAIEGNDDPLGALIDRLRQNRGDLQLYARDFEGATRGSRFYPMLYMMTRVWNARDFEMGTELKAHLLGKQSSLQLHHIFPKFETLRSRLLQVHGERLGELHLPDTGDQYAGVQQGSAGILRLLRKQASRHLEIALDPHGSRSVEV